MEKQFELECKNFLLFMHNWKKFEHFKVKQDALSEYFYRSHSFYLMWNVKRNVDIHY